MGLSFLRGYPCLGWLKGKPKGNNQFIQGGADFENKSPLTKTSPTASKLLVDLFPKKHQVQRSRILRGGSLADSNDTKQVPKPSPKIRGCSQNRQRKRK